MSKLIFFYLLILFSYYSFSQQESVWVTHFEESGFISTPDYNETMQYFQILEDNSDFAELFTFGISPQNRELKYLLATREDINGGKFPQTDSHIRKLSKPIVLIINGIHSGEIGGKDASMMLMREILITKEKEYLLDSLNLIVIPIFNVDGHERKSKYNRINQNGPEEMGWRTTAQNLNLNRDWMKADAPEMQAMLRLINDWNPDFVIDTHTTDGADCQYTITYSVEKHENIFSETAEWLKKDFIFFLEREVTQKGYLIHPYVYLKNWNMGLDNGIIDWASSPRLSTGYFALRNRPALLIETHMIKPYKDRVYSTKAAIETTLEFVINNSTKLKELNKQADIDSRNLKHKYLPLAFSNSGNYEMINFKGYDYYWDSSAVSGTKRLVYTDREKFLQIKYFDELLITDSVKVAKGYYIPPEYSFLVEKLKLHGVNPNLITNDNRIEKVSRYKFKNVKLSENSYEGKQLVTLEYETFTDEAVVLIGSYLFLSETSNARLLTHLLEPKSADSFIRWGFMNQIFEQKEYYEDYVMEKLAEEMLENDPELKREFEEKLRTDEEFKNNPRARLDFFYKRSPYPDKHLNVYPILRIE